MALIGRISAGVRRCVREEGRLPRRACAQAHKAKARQRAQFAPGRPVCAGAHRTGDRRRSARLYGLHQTNDALDLKSSVALVLDQDTNEVLFSKNPMAVLPIASITKLMTALVVVEAGLPPDEILTVTDEDVDTEKNSRSRLRVGTQLTRGEMLHLALMSSENRAAHALGRHYPNGLPAFVAAMNRKARELQMADTRFNDPTGLSSQNQSSARDLATLVKTAYRHPIIRELSTSPEYAVQRRRPAAAVPHDQQPGAQSELGDRPAEDRLYLRGGALHGDAGQAGRPQADHGISRFSRQIFAARRRRAGAAVADRLVAWRLDGA